MDITADNIGHIITVLGWIVAFAFAVISNLLMFKKNRLFQEDLLQISNNHYHLQGVIDSASFLNESIHNFYAECEKLKLTIYSARLDSQKLKLLPSIYEKLPELYPDIMFGVQKINTWVKISNEQILKFEGYKKLEDEIAKTFSITDSQVLSQQSRWLRYQFKLDHLIQNEHKYSVEWNKHKQQIENVDEKMKADLVAKFKATEDKHMEHRLKLLNEVAEVLQELTEQSLLITTMVQKFLVDSNKQYIKKSKKNA